MRKVKLKRRMFIKQVTLFNKALQDHKEDTMFCYYMKKNISVMRDEYTLLIELDKAGVASPEMLEFVDKKEKMLADCAEKGMTDMEIEDSIEYRSLVKEYEKAIYDYDVNSNKINAFLIEDDRYDYVPIPYRYIPSELNSDLFEFINRLIEEDKEVLMSKAG